jgi:hypothetical protein
VLVAWLAQREHPCTAAPKQQSWGLEPTQCQVFGTVVQNKDNGAQVSIHYCLSAYVEHGVGHQSLAHISLGMAKLSEGRRFGGVCEG